MNPEVNDHVRPYWLECGKSLDKFNKAMKADARVDVLMLPVFDGVTQIKWRKAVGDGIGANGNPLGTNGNANETNGHSNGH